MCESIESILQSRKRQPFSELTIESSETHELILQQMIKKKQEHLENPLENHSIQPSLRARMVD